LDIRSDVAGRNFVRSSNVRKNTVVFGPTILDIPLLPYEKQLIQTIGVTEEEYRRFTAEAKRRGAVRPAAYDHIPDIQNAVAPGAATIVLATTAAKSTTTIILTNVAIGLVLTGVSYLLTPKPKMPSASKRRQIDLGDITGSSRFTPSRGFDTLAELADYQSSIPIIFGRYDAVEGVGGMLVTPKLVWSRMFSFGTLQQAKLMFVVGEQGIASNGIGAPELEGIFLGNNALDAVYNDFFAFYWRNDDNNGSLNNIVKRDKQYGEHGLDVDKAHTEVFTAPTLRDPRDLAFCHAYSPVNNTEFGMHTPIANGTGYRLNYQIISIPDGIDRAPLRQQVLTRVKIAGTRDDENLPDRNYGNKDYLKAVKKQKQDSLGRNYSPRMGIVSVGSVTASASEKIKQVKVTEGDEAVFLISHEGIPEDLYKYKTKGESVDDINSSIEALQIAADDAMQEGELFAIGGTIWQVTKRKLRDNARFDPDKAKDQEITLKCVDTSTASAKRIGIVSKSSVINPGKGYIGDTYNGADAVQNVDEIFYPITKIAVATVRNNRPTLITEIGLKSTVFQRLNGLCAFNSLPTPTEIREYDDDEVNVRTGQISSTIQKTSIFRVFLRKAGDADKAFSAVPLFFAIRGSAPVAQYNFIRILNKFSNDVPVQLEYKFVPMSGAELNRLDKETQIVDLSHSPAFGSANLEEILCTVPTLGSIEVHVSGQVVTLGNLTENKEFFRQPKTIQGSDTILYPDSVVAERAIPKKLEVNSKLKALEYEYAFANFNSRGGKAGAFAYALLEQETHGDPTVPPDNKGLTRVRRTLRSNWSENKILTFEKTPIITKEFLDDGSDRWVKLQWNFVKFILRESHYAYDTAGWSWYVSSVRVIGSKGNFTLNEEIDFKRGSESTNVNSPKENYPASNPFQNAPGGPLTFSGLRFRVTQVDAEEVGGRKYAYYYKIFGNPANLSIGEEKEIQRVLTANGKQVTVKMKSTVKRLRNHFSGETKAWTDPVINVVKTGATDQTWEQNEEIQDIVSISSNNPFYTVYDQVGQVYKIGSLQKVSVPPKNESEAVFADKTQFSDISFYRDLVEKSNASSPEHEIVYVNEVQENIVNDEQKNPTFASLTMAGLSLKAGRQFTSLDQLRVWLGDGIQVRRLHPDDEDIGPSNLLTDLVFYLLTDRIGGAGALLNMTEEDIPLVDKAALKKTARFLRDQKLFFNGAITDRTNLRSFIADIAPFFLCNFIVSNGKFSLKPALPVFEESGQLNTGSVSIKQIFTEGNILEDTYKVDYLSSEERRPFKAVVRYRKERRNQLPEEQSITVQVACNPAEGFDSPQDLPVEQFDLTQFCTSEHHAVLVAKYFLNLRRYVTHTINFSTTLEGLSIEAGSFIKVVTEASPYNSANTGTVDANGFVTSLRSLPSGQFNVTFFKSGSDDLEEGVMSVSSGFVSDSTFHDSVFTIVDLKVSQNIYVVEQLTFSQEGTVDIVASEHPCDDRDRSLLVQGITGDTLSYEII
jgi:hypothetical protein